MWRRFSRGFPDAARFFAEVNHARFLIGDASFDNVLESERPHPFSANASGFVRAQSVLLHGATLGRHEHKSRAGLLVLVATTTIRFIARQDSERAAGCRIAQLTRI